MLSKTQSDTKMGYEQYALLPADGKRHEIVDGQHVVNPAPATYHQTLSRRIQFQLYTQIELKGLGQVFDAPTDLQLSDTDIVQPDLIVVLESNRRIITRTHIKGVPDIVVEILSDSSKQHDRVDKRALYQSAGIREYWIVDPESRVLEQLILRDRGYELAGRHARSVTADVITAASVDLEQVW